MFKNAFGVIVLVAGISVISPGFGADQNIVLSKDLEQGYDNSEELRSVHSVMIAQRERMRTIMDGFMLGDAKVVKEAVDHLDEDMRYINKNIPVDKGKEAEVWQAMLYILNRAKLMKRNVDGGEYQKAFTDFAFMTSQCIQCHEVTRGWGALEVQRPLADESDSGPKKNKKPIFDED